MRKKDEKKEPIVNEEYEDQEHVCCNGAEDTNSTGACCNNAEDMNGTGTCCNNAEDTKGTGACCNTAEDTNTSCNAADGSGTCCKDGDMHGSGSSGEEKESRCNAKEEGKNLAELEQKLKEAVDRKDEYLSMAQRIQAEFDNYKRRNKNAVADAYNSATADTVEAFLPVLDNLERAIDSASGTDSNESFCKGIELVQRQFVDTLTRLGVEEIEALGKPFDPELHHAVGQVDAKEGQEENTVAAVLLKGYKTSSKVIRYSMVHVVR